MEQDITQLEKLNGELTNQRSYKYEYIKGIAYAKGSEPENHDTEAVLDEDGNIITPAITTHADWEASLTNLEGGLTACKASIENLQTSISTLEDTLLS